MASIFIKPLSKAMKSGNTSYTIGLNKSKWKLSSNYSLTNTITFTTPDKFLEYDFSELWNEVDLHIIKCDNPNKVDSKTWTSEQVTLTDKLELTDINTFKFLENNGLKIDKHTHVSSFICQLYRNKSIVGLKWLLEHPCVSDYEKRSIIFFLLSLHCEIQDKESIVKLVGWCEENDKHIYWEKVVRRCYEQGLNKTGIVDYLLNKIIDEKTAGMLQREIVKSDKFIQACKDNNLDLVKECINESKRVSNDSTTEVAKRLWDEDLEIKLDYTTAFFAACANKNVEMATLIWNKSNDQKWDIGYSVNNRYSDICKYGNKDLLLLCIEIMNNYDSSRYNNLHFKLFQTCCGSGQLELAKYIHANFEFKIEYIELYSLFTWCCKLGEVNVANWIYDTFEIYKYIKNGVFERITSFSEYNQYLFTEVCIEGHIDMAKWILDKGIFYIDLEMAFRASCERGQLIIAIWLMRLSKKNKKGMISRAKEITNPEIDIRKVNLQACIMRKHYDVLMYLDSLDAKNKLSISKYIE